MNTVKTITRIFRRSNISFRFLTFENFEEKLNFHTDISIFFQDNRDLQKSLKLIANTKVRRSVLVILDSVGDEEATIIRNETEKLRLNSYFYLVYKTNDSLIKWYQVITLNRRSQVCQLFLIKLILIQKFSTE